MDECDSINSENYILKDACTELKRDIRELDNENKIFESEKVKFDMRTLVLQEDLDILKGTLSMKEEAFATNFTKLENESLELK